MKKLSYEINWINSPDMPRNVYYSDAMLIGLVCLTISITCLLFTLSHKKIKNTNIMLSGLIWWTILGGLFSFIAKGMSYVFVLPVIFISIGWIINIKVHKINKRVKDIILFISTVPVLIIFIPIIWSASTALGMNRVPYIMILIVLIISLVYNSIDVLMEYKKMLIIGVLILGLGFIAKDIITYRFTEDNPKPNSLMYTYNMDKDEALWATYDMEMDEWTGKYINETDEKVALKEFFPYNNMPIFTVDKAPKATFNEPKIDLIENQDSENNRYFKFNLKGNSPEGSLILYFENQLEDISDIKVEGQEITLDEEQTIEFIAIPDKGITLEIELNKKVPLKIKAIDHLLGYPEEVEPRKENMMPRGSYYILTDYTYVLRTYEY